jgi:hypothetical protein
MKGFIVSLLMIISASTFATENLTSEQILSEFRNECRTTVVTVDEIVKNSHIKGHITGLPSNAYGDFKVVFYVKTNRWYVHPYSHYENQEEGYSYSNLSQNGTFWVRTVRRDVPAQKLAVVLVPRSYKIARQKFWLKPLFGIFGGVLKGQCNHTIVPGNGDFFI